MSQNAENPHGNRRVKKRRKGSDIHESTLTEDDSNHKYEFENNSNVLCFYKGDGQVYSARIVKRELKKQSKKEKKLAKARKEHYFLHFIGWNQKCDLWIDPCDIIAANEANLKQFEIYKQSKKANKNKWKSKSKSKSKNNESNENSEQQEIDIDNSKSKLKSKSKSKSEVKEKKAKKGSLWWLIDTALQREKVLSDENHGNHDNNVDSGCFMSGLYDDKKDLKNRKNVGKALKFSISPFLRDNLVCQWKLMVSSENNTDNNKGYIIPLPKKKEFTIRHIMKEFKIWVKSKCENDKIQFIKNQNKKKEKANSNDKNEKAVSKRGKKRKKRLRDVENGNDKENDNSNDNNENENEKGKNEIEEEFEECKIDLSTLTSEEQLAYQKLLKQYQLLCEVIDAIMAMFNHLVFRQLLYTIELPQAVDLQIEFNLDKIKYGKLIDTSKKEREKRNESSNGNENDDMSDIDVTMNGNRDGNNENDNEMSNENEIDYSHIREPIDIYGAEHLVRLFVKLPKMVQKFVNFLEVDSIAMKEQCNVLLKYLANHKTGQPLFEYCNDTSSNQSALLTQVGKEYLQRMSKIQIVNE